MESLFRFSLIFFYKNIGLVCSGVFIKVNPFISSLEKTGNGWVIIFGFVTDSFHIGWRSSINNTRRLTSLYGLSFWRTRRKGFLECWKISSLCPWVLFIVTDIVILGLLEKYFQLVSEKLFERYQKNKLHCLLWGKWLIS